MSQQLQDFIGLAAFRQQNGYVFVADGGREK